MSLLVVFIRADPPPTAWQRVTSPTRRPAGSLTYGRVYPLRKQHVSTRTHIRQRIFMHSRTVIALPST